MPFDPSADVPVELDFLMQSSCVVVGVAGSGEVLRDLGLGAHEGGHGLVKGNPQRLGLDQSLRIRRVAAKVPKELLHLAGERNRLAKVAVAQAIGPGRVREQRDDTVLRFALGAGDFRHSAMS